ncbi:hypothetical protein DFJ74DRAFT_689176 [Hyaloraphidium curvatum]|nr:hypothetical protein DFJ74DRAFT_689176 [Hyaloraphidium curvatum]
MVESLASLAFREAYASWCADADSRADCESPLAAFVRWATRDADIILPRPRFPLSPPVWVCYIGAPSAPHDDGEWQTDDPWIVPAVSVVVSRLEPHFTPRFAVERMWGRDLPPGLAVTVRALPPACRGFDTGRPLPADLFDAPLFRWSEKRDAPRCLFLVADRALLHRFECDRDRGPEPCDVWIVDPRIPALGRKYPCPVCTRNRARKMHEREKPKREKDMRRRVARRDKVAGRGWGA